MHFLDNAIQGRDSGGAIIQRFSKLDSLLKNPFAPSSAPGSGPNTAFSWRFGLVLGLSWTADRAEAYFFNSDSGPLLSHPEAMKMDPSPALFSHQAGVFFEVELRVYGVLRSPQPRARTINAEDTPYEGCAWQLPSARLPSRQPKEG